MVDITGMIGKSNFRSWQKHFLNTVQDSNNSFLSVIFFGGQSVKKKILVEEYKFAEYWRCWFKKMGGLFDSQNH